MLSWVVRWQYIPTERNETPVSDLHIYFEFFVLIFPLESAPQDAKALTLSLAGKLPGD